MKYGFSCPHCGMDYDGLEYIDCADMDGEFDMCCEGCEKEFIVKFSTVIKFKTEKRGELLYMKLYKVVLNQKTNLDKNYKRMIEIILATSELDSIYPRKDEWEEEVVGLKHYEVILKLTNDEYRALINNGFVVKQLLK